jgi:hypothetical protein
MPVKTLIFNSQKGIDEVLRNILIAYNLAPFAVVLANNSSPSPIKKPTDLRRAVIIEHIERGKTVNVG